LGYPAADATEDTRRTAAELPAFGKQSARAHGPAAKSQALV
jgi:hypothetical protein